MASPISHLIAFWECDMHAELVLDWKCRVRRKGFMRDNRAVASYPLLVPILLQSSALGLESSTEAGNSRRLFLTNYQHDYLVRHSVAQHDHGTKGKARWQHLRRQTNCVIVEPRTKYVSPVTQMDLACAWPVNNHSTLHKLLQASAVDPWGKPASSALSPGNEHSVLVEQREQRATGLGHFLKYHLSIHASLASFGAWCQGWDGCQWCTHSTWLVILEVVLLI